jgi:purine-binding chemotaxis protein CheW
MPDDATEAHDTLLIFRVDEHQCAIPAAAVQEILPMMAMLRPPGTPEIVEGFLNLRGSAVPAVSFRRLFRLPAAEFDLYTPLVLVRTDELVIAFIADEVTGVARVPHSRLQPVPQHHTPNDCAEASFESDTGYVSVLAPRRLLLAKEQAVLAELASGIRGRLEELGAPGV